MVCRYSWKAPKRYDANKLRYNFSTRKGVISTGSTELEGGYYLGEKIKKVDEDIFFIKNGRYTTCDKAEPDYYFGSPKLKIIQGDKVIAEPVYLFIDDVPIFALPFGIFPNHLRRSSVMLFPRHTAKTRLTAGTSHISVTSGLLMITLILLCRAIITPRAGLTSAHASVMCCVINFRGVLMWAVHVSGLAK